MSNKENPRSWPLIERISLKAAALLREGEELENNVIDFSDIFETKGPKTIKESFRTNGKKALSRRRPNCGNSEGP